MKKKHSAYNGIELRYKSVRGDKKFRLPPSERTRAFDDKNPYRDQLDNNPGHTPPARNPDEL